MNNEIKEIISDLQRVADRKCYPEDILCGSIAQEWIDYITDLQQENERLKKELFSKLDNEITLKTTDGQTMTIIQSERIDMQEKLNKSLEETYKKYNDYKSRNEKAIEHLKEVMKDEEEYEEDYIYNKHLLNILQGSEKSEKTNL